MFEWQWFTLDDFQNVQKKKMSRWVSNPHLGKIQNFIILPTICKHFYFLFLKHLMMSTRTSKNFDKKNMRTGSLVAFFSIKAEKNAYFFIFWHKNVEKNFLFSKKIIYIHCTVTGWAFGCFYFLQISYLCASGLHFEDIPWFFHIRNVDHPKEVQERSSSTLLF